MAEFMVMVMTDEARDAALAPAETKGAVEGHALYEQNLRAVSAYLDGERLRPSAEGRRVRLRDGKPEVEIGPFGEPTLAGFYLLRAETLEKALALTSECPLSPGTSLEVRPIMKSFTRPEKASQQGRVFAFAVLGAASHERGWIEVMDRIDESTGDHFPADRFLGGLRLEAPRQGRRITSTGNQRTIFDGPFLESKEVVGGLFFMRFRTIEEASHWALESEFMKHGALEIRQLWRS